MAAAGVVAVDTVATDIEDLEAVARGIGALGRLEREIPVAGGTAGGTDAVVLPLDLPVGNIPQRAVPPAKAPRELNAPGERRITLYLKTQLPSLMMGFNVPGLATAEQPRQVHALRLIAALLDGGYSARLATRLERGEELVSGASAWYNGYPRGDSLFVLSATPNVQTGKTLAQAEAGSGGAVVEARPQPYPQALHPLQIVGLAHQPQGLQPRSHGRRRAQGAGHTPR